jgi:hypothetical protein
MKLGSRYAREAEMLVADQLARKAREFSTVFLKEHFSYRIVHTFSIIEASLTARIDCRKREE